MQTRTVYYCSYTNNNDALPSFSKPFLIEAEARTAARALAADGFWGAIEQHQECKQHFHNDLAWQPDWDHAGDSAIQMLDYF